MSVWLPCPACGDDSSHRAGMRRKPQRCACCGRWAAVALVDGRWVAVLGRPGANRTWWRRRNVLDRRGERQEGGR